MANLKIKKKKKKEFYCYWGGGRSQLSCVTICIYVLLTFPEFPF